ncbi:RPM1 interacting protein 2 [Actinidia rufa]|uniref:RPM1 interacting protein 2 n=1 Tax=Actinidia rufa TaxID=165716 RepID=A0A7J0ED80_9ERIC|nr:RPM1 interacting protein 2 [Actinidia rufa]
MGVSYLSISAVCTLLSFVGLQYWTELSLKKLTSDGLIGEESIEPGNAHHVLQLLLGSQATIALLANFALNVFILLILGLKTIFFAELYSSETRKLVERLINYVIYKGTFLPLVFPSTIFQAALWSTWLAILCSLKMFQALARDRLERLNASPSATPWTYFLKYLLFSYISKGLYCTTIAFCARIKLCLVIYRTLDSSMFLLLFFEPLSIAFETLQGNGISDACCGLDLSLLHLDESDCRFIMGMERLSHPELGFLFGHHDALLSAIVKRTKGFIRLRKALGALHGALPDATPEEIRAYDDECAICREPMAKAKRLSCNHLFHLACLRSWLDQGLSGNYSCPTCRKPLQMGRPEDEPNLRAVDVSNDEQLARQLSSGFDRNNPPGRTLPTGVLPNQMQNPLDGGAWRGTGLDSSWLHTWSGQGLDGAGPSTGIRSAGLGRVQMMMRHLAAVGETYTQTALEDTAWSLWPMNPSQAGTSSSTTPPASTVRYPGTVGGLHTRTVSRAANDNIASLLAMAETVREVLPHIPDELIFQALHELTGGDDRGTSDKKNDVRIRELSMAAICWLHLLSSSQKRVLRVEDNGRFGQVVTSPSKEEAEKFKLNMDSAAKGEENGNITQNSMESKTINKKMFNRYAQEAIPGSIPIKKPLVSVSDEHFGLFSDYSRPRTRPPSHN